MSVTRRGVYTVLSESPYKLKLHRFTFYFSSLYRLNLFKKKYLYNRELLLSDIKYNYGCTLEDTELLADITLYNKINIKGFLIETERGVKYECLEQVRLGLALKIDN